MKRWRDLLKTWEESDDWVRVKHAVDYVDSATENSSGEKWEIRCAREERKKIIGLWIYKDDFTTPSERSGYDILPWTWQGVANFIDGL